MIRLLIIADDFTGALDTGVQFAACGAVTRVITDRRARLAQYRDACQVLVVDAETRHLPAGEAYDIVFGIVRQAEEVGIPHIFKKTDSALRGNIGAELAALLEASGEWQLPFLPAFPQMNRCTVGGIHYIGDKPVAESVFGADPFDPVTHSRVAEVIGEQRSLPVAESLPLTDGMTACDMPGIVVYDGSALEQLAATARCLHGEGKLHIMAGCAGFACVLPGLLGLGTGEPRPLPPLEENFLVICGSVNPITTAQSDFAEREGFLRLRLTPEQKLEPDYWHSPEGERDFLALRDSLRQKPFRIIDTNDPGSNAPTADYARVRGMTVEDVRQAVSRSVGCLVSRLFPEEDLGTLLITGGDTLRQCMDYMDIREMEPLGELASGVVLSRFAYRGVTRYVISKSGGFGRENLFPELTKRIAGQTGK